jgi:hypothetical protein
VAATASSQQQSASGTAGQQQQAAGAASRAPQRPPSARHSGQGPIYTLAAAPKGGVFTAPAPQPGFLRPHQLRYDVSALLQFEYARQLERQRAARQAEVEATVKGLAVADADVGFRYRSHRVCVCGGCGGGGKV